MAALNSTLLIVWDFDWSLVNENSDTWIVQKLGGDEEYQHMRSRRGDLQWTKLMNYECNRLTSGKSLNGKTSTLNDVHQCMGTLPVFDENLSAVRLAGSNPSVVQCIVSDANTCFIESFVRHHDLSSCFDEIHTNPASWSEESEESEESEKSEKSEKSVLSVGPYHHDHGCQNCRKSPNMCKGNIVDDLVNRLGPFDKMLYVGDGRGDLCGCLRFTGVEDVVLARKDYALEKCLVSWNEKARSAEDNAASDSVKHISWSTGQEIFDVVQQKIAMLG